MLLLSLKFVDCSPKNKQANVAVGRSYKGYRGVPSKIPMNESNSEVDNDDEYK